MLTDIQFGFNHVKSYTYGHILKKISMPSDGSHLRFLINAKTSHFVKDHESIFQQNSLSNSLGVSNTNNLKK